MVNVWFFKNPDKPTERPPNYTCQVDEAIEKLDLESAISLGRAKKPVFNGDIDRLADFKEPEHVLVEITADESVGEYSTWKPGYYVLQLSPRQVRNRLQPKKGD